MNIHSQFHTKNSGLILSSLKNDSLTSLKKDYLLSNLNDHGYIILRNFDSNLDNFSKLVKQTSSRISLDPARQFFGDTAQKVDAGYDEVGLHCENGNSPFWPDLCWFYCQVAPQKGSQTTICDGKQVYQQLPAHFKKIFNTQKIMYSRSVEQHKWKTYAYHALHKKLKAPKKIEDITFEDLLNLVSGDDKENIILNKDASIFYKFKTFAVRASNINPMEKNNFANSIFGPSNHYQKPIISFEDDSNIPQNLLKDTSSICDHFTYNVEWQQGDIVLIDNTRVMHGRRKIEDTSRTIFNALSYI